MVGQCPNGEKEIEQVADQNRVKDGGQVEGQISAKRLSDCTTQTSQNLKQKGMTVREYTEAFYQVNLRVGYTEDTIEKTARYVNGLRL